ncbi:site-specific integrase [Paeniglutamicibacter sp. MACA_103]|uniref:site-specific integrase n=1 Tax=Paeniglutamicibacter sp. MACA_103 TaxID=3377337 RepID=UPI0038967992
MDNQENVPRVLARLEVPPSGALVATGEPFEPFRLVDATGESIGPAAAYFAELLACGRSAKTLRSYGMDLLRWFRFLAALEVEWDQATRVEGRDFCRWLQVTRKPVRPHWRHPDGGGPIPETAAGAEEVAPGPGATPEGDRYAAVTVAHCESVLRSFYDFHLEAGTGPMLNPFPLARSRAGSRGRAPHNSTEGFGGKRRGRYRPKVVTVAPKAIPDQQFDRLFAALGSHRDRALVAFWVSTGTGRWWRSGSRPGPGPRSCWVPRSPMRIPGSN